MALKVLMLRRERDRLNKQIETLRENEEKFKLREADLEKSIGELADDATEEERKAVEEEIEKLDKERAENKEQMEDLDSKVRDIEEKIAAEEEGQPGDPEPEPEPAPAPAPNDPDEGGKENTRNKKEVIPKMVRGKFFRKMAENEVRTMVARDDVQNFLTEVRSAISEKREITNVGLLIPEVFLGLIRENLMEYSKLYKHVDVRVIGGRGRTTILGEIPEGIWTDCCGNLNELNLAFYGAEMDCWKVGAYAVVCQANLEDSDIDLASEILTALSQAIGIALDKAIIFGLGTRMPVGFFTRLAETSQPSDYPADALPWVDYHTTNIKTIASSVTGIELFRQFIVDSAAAKGKYSRGEKVWIMNETTYTALIAAAMTVDAGGAIVAGVNGVMPVVGGIIEVLDFVPDNMIFGGFLDNYVLAERAGVTLNESEHVQFIQDNIVFKARARYDGKPVIPQAFVAIGINGTTPSANSIVFAPDVANAESN